MELFNLTKQSLSIISGVTLKDEEIKMWINSGKKDLLRQGINGNLEDPLIYSAIVMFVKGHFGNTDIKEKELAQETYNLLCHNLSLSQDYKVVEGNV